MAYDSLTERERTILQAVIEAYIETAEPAGSRRIVRQYDLDISAATVRNTMADLETKGFLTHPHTSAGRMPTDLAYRYYVDALMGRQELSRRQRERIEKELTGEPAASELESVVQRAARVLGLLTGELGLSVGPILAEAVLLKLDFVPIDSGKALMVLTLGSGVVRTVYVDLPAALPVETLAAVARIMNERLAGSTLREIHASLIDRGPGGRGYSPGERVSARQPAGVPLRRPAQSADGAHGTAGAPRFCPAWPSYGRRVAHHDRSGTRAAGAFGSHDHHGQVRAGPGGGRGRSHRSDPHAI